jgi:hypothetical protein
VQFVSRAEKHSGLARLQEKDRASGSGLRLGEGLSEPGPPGPSQGSETSGGSLYSSSLSRDWGFASCCTVLPQLEPERAFFR